MNNALKDKYRVELDKCMAKIDNLQTELCKANNEYYIAKCRYHLSWYDAIVLTDTNMISMFKEFNLEQYTTTVILTMHKDHVDAITSEWKISTSDRDLCDVTFQLTNIMRYYDKQYKEDVDGDVHHTRFFRTYTVTAIRRI